MSPVLTILLAAAIANGEPVHVHLETIVAAVEVDLASACASTSAETRHLSMDVAFWYGPATGFEETFLRRASCGAPPRVTYSLATPVFRDLL